MRSSAVSVLACAIALFLPGGASSQDTPPARLHVVATGTNPGFISFTAESIVKQDGATRYESLIHLKGNVEIRTCCVATPTGNSGSAYLIMNAEEADYDGEAGTIDARGPVHVHFQTRR